MIVRIISPVGNYDIANSITNPDLDFDQAADLIDKHVTDNDLCNVDAVVDAGGKVFDYDFKSRVFVNRPMNSFK